MRIKTEANETKPVKLIVSKQHIKNLYYLTKEAYYNKDDRRIFIKDNNCITVTDGEGVELDSFFIKACCGYDLDATKHISDNFLVALLQKDNRCLLGRRTFVHGQTYNVVKLLNYAFKLNIVAFLPQVDSNILIVDSVIPDSPIEEVEGRVWKLGKYYWCLRVPFNENIVNAIRTYLHKEPTVKLSPIDSRRVDYSLDCFCDYVLMAPIAEPIVRNELDRIFKVVVRAGDRVEELYNWLSLFKLDTTTLGKKGEFISINASTETEVLNLLECYQQYALYERKGCTVSLRSVISLLFGIHDSNIYGNLNKITVHLALDDEEDLNDIEGSEVVEVIHDAGVVILTGTFKDVINHFKAFKREVSLR